MPKDRGVGVSIAFSPQKPPSGAIERMVRCRVGASKTLTRPTLSPTRQLVGNAKMGLPHYKTWRSCDAPNGVYLANRTGVVPPGSCDLWTKRPPIALLLIAPSGKNETPLALRLHGLFGFND